MRKEREKNTNKTQYGERRELQNKSFRLTERENKKYINNRNHHGCLWNVLKYFFSLGLVNLF